MNTTLWMFTTILLFLVDSCTEDPTRYDNSTTENHKTTENELPPDKSNARNSLDYYGTYTGILPCADCEGIKTTLQLLPDQQYVLHYVYEGKEPGNLYERTGSWSWEEDNTTITLDNIDKPNQYKVVENALIHLDRNGELITGELADQYRLEKQ